MAETLNLILNEMESHEREQSGGTRVVLPKSPRSERLLSGSAAG